MIRRMRCDPFPSPDPDADDNVEQAGPDADGDTDFGNISLGKPAARQSEIDEYLAQPVEPVKDALAWWVNKEHVFPKLSKMARDYLSIPGKLS
jgi:hypothetical protein